MDANGGSKSQVCREYLRGECDRGNNCKFSHPDSSEAIQEFEEKICRDFLRDECIRGDKCIYKHPPGMKGAKKEVKFCHNFQNGKCPRIGCTYLHCTAEDEEYYNKTGKLPPGLEEVASIGQNSKVCKDFLNGKCFRSQCKFAHPGPEYREGPPRKRPMPSWDDEYYPPMRDERERIRSLMHLVDDLEDENTVLRHKLSRMHRQVLDLTEDNKILLDENRRLRGSEAEGSRPAVPLRRADGAASDEASLDSYLRERVPSVSVARVPAAMDPVSARAARNASLDTERLHSYEPQRAKFAKYDY